MASAVRTEYVTPGVSDVMMADPVASVTVFTGWAAVLSLRPSGTTLMRVRGAVLTVMDPGALALAVSMLRRSWATTTPGLLEAGVRGASGAAKAGVAMNAVPTTAMVHARVLMSRVCMSFSFCVLAQGMSDLRAR
jgi:hypothetical protein